MSPLPMPAPWRDGVTASGGNIVIKNIICINTTLYTYRSTLGATPVAMWENGTLIQIEASALSVDQTPGSWYYDGTYLYIYASDNSNVATNGKTYTYVTASSPSYTTWDNAQAWLIFDSLDQALSTGAQPKPMDWFAFGDAWNRSTKRYSTETVGDTYSVSQSIAESLNLLPKEER